MAHTNHQVTIVEGNGFPLIRRKAYPNEPCRCGSGKKTKRCCGTDTNFMYSKLSPDQEKKIIQEEEKERAKELKKLFKP